MRYGELGQFFSIRSKKKRLKEMIIPDKEQWIIKINLFKKQYYNL